MNIAQIKKLESGTAVDSVSGIVVKVAPEKSGTNKFGRPWRMLPVYIKDQTGEIKLTLWNPRQVPSVGKPITVTASGEKGGVNFEAEPGTDRNGNSIVWMGIKVSESASVEMGGSPDGGSSARTGSLALSSGGTLGQTVGMSLKLAGDIWLAQGEPYSGEATIARIETIARAIICASHRLEKFDPSTVKAAPVKTVEKKAPYNPEDEFEGLAPVNSGDTSQESLDATEGEPF